MASLALTCGFYAAVESDDPLFRLSMATAYGGLVLLAATLFVGPVNLFRARPNPVSTDLRRDLGIWSAALGLVHFGVGLQVHMRGKWWTYFLDENARLIPVRADLFGLANYTGLVGTIVLALLLVISNDLSLRQLGTSRWKAVQRWNYVGGVMVVVHGVAYQIIENRAIPLVATFTSICVLTLVVQLAGRRRTLTSRSPARVS
jgi:sulfoxide reductase heme-binding subunit YedZ